MVSTSFNEPLDNNFAIFPKSLETLYALSRIFLFFLSPVNDKAIASKIVKSAIPNLKLPKN